MTTETSTCSICEQELPADCFRRSSSKKNGRHSYCRPCAAQWRKERLRDPVIAERERAKYRKPPKQCAGCGVEIPALTHSGHCSQCYPAHSRRVKAASEKRRAHLPERQAARRLKEYRRRGARKGGDITKEQLAALLRVTHCQMCGVKMTGTPYTDTSREIDHIVPLIMGGMDTLGNLRAVCRRCNCTRPHDGSDYTGPVSLWAATPVFSDALQP